MIKKLYNNGVWKESLGMYLTERIIGIITYMGVMLTFIILIYGTKSRKKLKRYLIIYWFILAIMAFFYIPDKSADLSRLWEELHRYSKVSFEKLMNIISNTSTPSRALYFWSISKLGIDGFLPAITSMIFFGNIFTITYKCAEKYNIDNKNIALSLLFFMEFGKFLETISGIRSLMAFSIIAFCVYKEIIEDKKIIKNILLYIFAAFMHPAAMILTLIRLMFLLIQKEKTKVKRIINIILFIILGYLIYRFGSKSITAATNKAESYMGHEVYSYIWEYIVSWIYIIFSTYTIIKYNKYFMNEERFKNLRNFILFINAIVIILNFEYSIFSRFQTFSSILFIPTFAFILQKMSVDKNRSKNYTYLYLIITVLVFVLVGTRGNLSGYKFFII